MSKPSNLLIPASFCLPEFYDNIVDAVTAKGVEIHALHYPSAQNIEAKPWDGQVPTMNDDAAFIAEETKKLADQGKDVILIAHSYGGVPATENTTGLSKQERREQSKNGGIVRLAYITAVVPPLGLAAEGVLAGRPAENQENGWLWQESISNCAAIVFSDLPQEEAEAWQRQLVQHSAASFGGELTHAGYKDIPVSYLFCDDDVVITPKFQQNGIELIERESGMKVEVTSAKARHCPNVSKPQEVIEWIVDLVGGHTI